MQEFTKHQLEIARLIADGLTYEEMGKRLGISSRIAKYQTDIIRRKLGVRNKRSIPRIMRDLGIID